MNCRFYFSTDIFQHILADAEILLAHKGFAAEFQKDAADAVRARSAHHYLGSLYLRSDFCGKIFDLFLYAFAYFNA
ncbi:hypothetical protein BMS3Bbin11_01270 [bacterium BMS3Bbin11]|nr:hypothetical protein BMS3Bbin11_01270 [bacterium BMS3Bbin11]